MAKFHKWYMRETMCNFSIHSSKPLIYKARDGRRKRDSTAIAYVSKFTKNAKLHAKIIVDAVNKFMEDR